MNHIELENQINNKMNHEKLENHNKKNEFIRVNLLQEDNHSFKMNQTEEETHSI